MYKELDKCNLCPKRCLVNRNNNEKGFCKSGNKIKIAKAYLHKWEEPCISGTQGSGTIFFSHCNLKCIYCQNYLISEECQGVEITTQRFSEICLELQNKGAHNINLVTPTPYIPLIIDGIKLAKKNGLTIPIIYNSSGYESVQTIKMLDGIIDIYLPDFKYYSNEFAIKYSKCQKYFKYASESIDEMIKQKGKCFFDKNGLIKSGVIVRHLLLPGMENDSKKIIEYLYNKYGNKIYLSIMNQYTPIRNLKYEELNHKVNNKIYDDIIDYAWNLGIRQAFIQEGNTQNKSFIPNWDFKG